MQFEEIDAIRECLDTQIEYAGKSWDKLIAESKVVPSPSLKANAQKLNTKYDKIDSYYQEYYKKIFYQKKVIQQTKNGMIG